MSLSDLASVGSLVSGLADLLSLIYLAPQVRQTKKSAGAAHAGDQHAGGRIFRAQYLQPDISDLYAKVRRGERHFV